MSDVLALRFQPHRDAGERAAGADGADEAVDLALRVVPDLWRRRLDMALAVGDIVELIGPDGAVRRGRGKLLGEAPGIFYVIVRILVGDCGNLDQLGAGKPEHVLLLVGLRVGDDDDRLQPKRVADEGKPDAGIAGRAFHHRAARLKAPRVERVADDEERGAVLHRLAWVHELGLAEDQAARLFRGALELDQRGVADRLDDAVTVMHGKVQIFSSRGRNLKRPARPRKVPDFQGSALCCKAFAKIAVKSLVQRHRRDGAGNLLFAPGLDLAWRIER